MLSKFWELTEDLAKRLDRFGLYGLQLTNAQMVVRVADPTVAGEFRNE